VVVPAIEPAAAVESAVGVLRETRIKSTVMMMPAHIHTAVMTVM